MPNFIQKILNRFDGHMQELLHGASIAFVLKILAAGFAFGLNVVLARLLGAEGSGIFFLAFTIVLIVAAIGRVGMENALVRFIAANIAADQPGKVLGVYHKAMFYSLVTSCVLSSLLYLLAPWMSNDIFSKPALEQPLTIMAMAVVPLALLTLHAHALQGLKRIAASISVLSVIVPFLTCIIAILFVLDYGINAAVWGYLIATIVTLLLGRWFWKLSTRSFKTHISEFDIKELLASSIPLFGVVIMNMIITWSPMLFLGIWESSEIVGIYSAASRTALLLCFVLAAVNSIAAPKFVGLYQKGDLVALELLSCNSAKIMIVFSLPILLLFLLIPESIMSIFGDQFKQGSMVLMILAVGQFINVAAGSVGILLMMTGNESALRYNSLFTLVVSLSLSVLIIPIFGIVGASLVASFTVILMNIISVWIVWKKIGILAVPIRFRNKKVL